MGSEDLARRFLHVNLNCESLDATEGLYAAQLGLAARMRSDPKVATDGTILGLGGETFCATAFLYDSRGGRAGCALEAIEFHQPALKADPNSDPTRPGIRSTLLTVADLDATVASLRAAGITVGGPVDGLISGSKSVLALDPDGVVIELAEAPSDKPGAVFAGIRVAAIDAVATGEFLTAIGFAQVQAPAQVEVAADQLAPGGSPTPVKCAVSRYALAEDAHQFTLTVVAHPDTRHADPVPWGGNRQGLYRCALRVENTEAAMSLVPNSVEVMGDPVWCPLPGTKIEGLYVSFLRSPDGVVFEFVERPLRHFSPAVARG
ncbi:VOC family protein [Mycobacterium rhizamassiliense]|uniref:VOC family protein n=1 Tax=Mycobacterium rhizamassiliense TaxID=1841860 RepID=UPI00097CED4C|nr:VOC family protein [Mycobacterium rhizamassiliense]